MVIPPTQFPTVALHFVCFLKEIICWKGYQVIFQNIQNLYSAWHAILIHFFSLGNNQHMTPYKYVKWDIHIQCHYIYLLYCRMLFPGKKHSDKVSERVAFFQEQVMALLQAICPPRLSINTFLKLMDLI